MQQNLHFRAISAHFVAFPASAGSRSGFSQLPNYQILEICLQPHFQPLHSGLSALKLHGSRKPKALPWALYGSRKRWNRRAKPLIKVGTSCRLSHFMRAGVSAPGGAEPPRIPQDDVHVAPHPLRPRIIGTSRSLSLPGFEGLRPLLSLLQLVYKAWGNAPGMFESMILSTVGARQPSGDKRRYR